MNEHLHHKQEMLLANLLHGKLPRNLRWNEAIELMGKIGRVEAHDGNEVEVVIGSQRTCFKRTNAHSLPIEEISHLRSFLREAKASQPPNKSVPLGRMIVVIDHHTARIYQDLGGGRAEHEATIEPYDPYGFRRHLIHRRAHFEGQRVPEETSFYEEIAEDLVSAKEIVLIGHGTGKSSALDFLVEYIQTHHPTIYPQIIATEVTDLSALTERGIEAIAKQHLH